MREEAGGDLCPFPASRQGGRKMAPLSPLPRTYCLPGLGQKAVVLFLQALGQTLQVFQLFIHGLGKLQSLLGAGGGRARRARRVRKTENTETDSLRGKKQQKSQTDLETQGDRDQRGGQRPERGRQRLRKKKKGGKNQL